MNRHERRRRTAIGQRPTEPAFVIGRSAPLKVRVASLDALKAAIVYSRLLGNGIDIYLDPGTYIAREPWTLML